MKFKIELTVMVDGNACVMARQVEPGEFHVSNSTRLGGVLLRQVLDIPRKLRKPDGSLDLDLFAFELDDPDDVSRLNKHDVVELLP